MEDFYTSSPARRSISATIPRLANCSNKNGEATHISGSIIGEDGCLYITDDEGRTTVFKNNANVEVLVKNSVGEGEFMSPAISQGSVCIRGEKHLFVIGPSH
jgi:hypothetical protein